MLVLKGYATGATTEALFKQHLGQDIRAVEAGFEAWMNSRLDRTISGWQPSPRGKIEARDKLLGQAIIEIRAKDYTTAARTLQQLVQGTGDGYPPRMLLGVVLTTLVMGNCGVGFAPAAPATSARRSSACARASPSTACPSTRPRA